MTTISLPPIKQISANSVVEKVFHTAKNQCQLRIYSPYPEMQVVIFSRRTAKLDFLTVPEVETLVNLTVKKFGLNPRSIVWVDHDLPDFEDPYNATFNLVTFDWHCGQASNPHWTSIEESWYFHWLENLDLEYISL